MILALSSSRGCKRIEIAHSRLLDVSDVSHDQDQPMDLVSGGEEVLDHRHVELPSHPSA
jgi:hypothetical protein